MLKPADSRGFTLIEMVVVVVISGLLLASAATGFNSWLVNSRVRSVAEQLANDLRQAQAEAVRRNRQVAVVLTNSNPTATPVTPATNATNWSIRALPLLNSTEGSNTTLNTTTVIGNLSRITNSDTTVTGDASTICFNSVGRLTSSTTTIADAGNATCTQPTTNTPTNYRVQNNSTNRPLWIQVMLGGQVRICDPNRLLPNQPDGCCTTHCCGLSSTAYCVF